MADFLGPYQLGYNDSADCGIYTGDARELAAAIPDESVDLIFTDPLYDHMDDYRWLAEIATRTLRPSGAVLTFCGIGYLPGTMQALCDGGLIYRWSLVLLHPTRNGCHVPGGFSHYTMMLWLDRTGETTTARPFRDIGLWAADPLGWSRVDDTAVARWYQSPIFTAYYAECFTSPASLVFDPFTGSGTIAAVCKMLGRQYLAFEIDPATADKARARVRNTQAPLFVPEPVQAGLWTE